jgi:hypothetical protein
VILSCRNDEAPGLHLRNTVNLELLRQVSASQLDVASNNDIAFEETSRIAFAINARSIVAQLKAADGRLARPICNTLHAVAGRLSVAQDTGRPNFGARIGLAIDAARCGFADLPVKVTPCAMTMCPYCRDRNGKRGFHTHAPAASQALGIGSRTAPMSICRGAYANGDAMAR